MYEPDTTLTEYRREITGFTVAFHLVSESSSGPLSLPSPRCPLHPPLPHHPASAFTNLPLSHHLAPAHFYRLLSLHLMFIPNEQTGNALGTPLVVAIVHGRR
ncbi:hypothetical protein EVAR_88056_1 [Eumeta japonica]|uniref:Uncharacterized protein n=1 Tax=Eumeta variegata TaxID=151549 RepID=A0A4C1WI73_EUMVA|nr:hypothetical protein EVAR_88056_1 [Eumeta japonica]